MRIKAILSGLMLAGALVSGAAQASLVDRGGGMIYDTNLNVTWLQDANYAKTSGYDADGGMSWSDANYWVQNLVYGGYSDWRLPKTYDLGLPGCNYSVNGTDCGYNVDPASGELAHLYYVTLKNPTPVDRIGRWDDRWKSYGDFTTGPFINANIYPNSFWSETQEYSSTPDNRKYYTFGFNGALYHSGDAWFNDGNGAWAVRDGDVAAAVPEPGSITLLGLGLAGLAPFRRKRVASN